MEHIDEKILELYVLEGDDVADKRNEIETHLKECAGCAALVSEINDYYKEVEEIRAQHTELNSKALTLRNMIVKIPPFGGEYQVPAIRMTKAARIILFVLRNPVKSAVGFLTTLAAAFWLMLPSQPIKDTNPEYARAKDEFLVVYNKIGQELWKKYIGVGYDIKDIPDPDINSIGNFLAMMDVNGDHKKEIIAIFGWGYELPLHNTVLCLNSDGSELWKYEFNRQMKFGDESYPNEYRVTSMIVGDFEMDSKIEVIAVAQHLPYYPTAVFKLDAATGTLQNEYWHSGHISALSHQDIDSDGVEEIFFGGEHNGYNQASLLILDPRLIEGHAPAPPTYTPADLQVGKEKYFLLFPTTDVLVWGTRKRNFVSKIRFTKNNLTEVDILETNIGTTGFGFAYYFNDSLNCIKIGDRDDFEALHRKLESEGKLSNKINEQYYEEYRRGIRYWDGEKFVHTPTMNKRYLNLFAR